MGEKTGIEWTDATFNSHWGCTKVSPTCDHCYAEAGSKRYGFNVWGKDADRRFFGDQHWQQPLRWNQKAQKEGRILRVFSGSYCDVMEDRPELKPVRERLFNLIERTDHLTWQLVTKRPQNFRRFLPQSWIETPRKNVWLLTTVESEDYLWRADALKTCPAIVHGLSVEPLLSDLPSIGNHLDDIEWLIVGGESGVGKNSIRPMKPEWATRLRDEAIRRRIPFFFKQWGNFAPQNNELVYIRSKKDAGCLLDGVEWKQFPDMRHNSV